MENKNIICFGDSITFGYCAEYGKDYISLLRAKIKEDFPNIDLTVRNKGENGNSSRDAINRIDEILAYKPILTIMLFGSNDSAYSGWYHVGLDEFSLNYDKLIYKLTEVGSKIILITPTPVIEDPYLPFIENNVLVTYCDIIKEKAKKYNLPLIDMNKIFIKANNGNLKSLLQFDGEHISTEGYQLFFENVYKTAKPILEELIK